MEYIISIVLIFIEVVSFGNLAECLCSKQSIAQKRKIFLIAFLIVFIICMQWLPDIVGLRSCLTMMIFFLFTQICYVAPLYKKITSVVFFCALNLSLDLGTLFSIRHVWNLSEAVVTSNPTFFMLGALLSKFSLFLLSWILKKLHIQKKNFATPNLKDWVPISAFLLGSLLNLYLLFEMSLIETLFTRWIMIAAVVIIITTISVFELTLVTEQARRREIDFQILHQQMMLETQHAIAITKMYAEQRKSTHDFKNHLLALQGLLEKQDFKAAEQYTHFILGAQTKSPFWVNSNHSMIDAILTQKYVAGQSKNITMEFMVGTMENFPMQDADIVVLFSNLLDNAIEAALKCPAEQCVRLKLVQDEVGIILSVQNTTILEASADLEHMKSTKKKGLHHGYGLLNIKEILQRYQYDYVTECKNGWFKFSVLMSSE